jgi:hypothetical protein
MTGPVPHTTGKVPTLVNPGTAITAQADPLPVMPTRRAAASGDPARPNDMIKLVN